MLSASSAKRGSSVSRAVDEARAGLCELWEFWLMEEREGGRRGVVGRERERERVRDWAWLLSMMVVRGCVTETTT
jgi:hypothetical protein